MYTLGIFIHSVATATVTGEKSRNSVVGIQLLYLYVLIIIVESKGFEDKKFDKLSAVFG